jgi:flavin-dependent dehydrogenase
LTVRSELINFKRRPGFHRAEYAFSFHFSPYRIRSLLNTIDMAYSSNTGIELVDGSRIAVIGGGPAGSFFSIYTLEYARRFDLELHLDIYEAKDLKKIGSAGCNHCGGIISESLVQELATDGLIIPSEVIQRGINSYTMLTEQGTRVIRAPSDERRIASVFRGCGPKGCLDKSLQGFDNFLLELCRDKGAEVIYEKVTTLDKTADGILVGCSKSDPRMYDLVVGAAGLNKKTMGLFEGICPAYKPPKVTRTYISEFFMKPADIEKNLGDSMHVFLLDIPKVTFGALVPKGNYVTLVLLGKEIDKEVVSNFIGSREVRSCFPPDFPLERATACQCYPFVNVKEGSRAFADRAVLIGDSASSKLYKNGIGAALITGKAAASTAVFEGISEAHFRKYFAPVCRDLDRDNKVGKLIFWVTKLIQKSPVLKRGLLEQIRREQADDSSALRMSSALWDTFTGSAGYRNILMRFLHPKLLTGLVSSILTSNIPSLNPRNHEKQEARQTL